MDSQQFLKRIWGKRKGYAVLSHKDMNGGWHDNAYKSPVTDVEDVLPDPENNDVYFCPNLFTGPHRRVGLVVKPRWLYADLDPVDPGSIDPRPTIAWESSPGRYQAVWRLDRALPTEQFNDLNKRLTYHLGADRGGWDLTQVLRVPGTRNHKYEERPVVEVLWSDGPVYKVSELRKMLEEVEPGSDSLEPVTDDFEVPDLTATQIFAKHRRAIKGRAESLLFQRNVVEGERSDRLWELENLLLSAGLTEGETFVVIRDSSWNKYRDRHDEVRRLKIEIQKAAATQRQLYLPGGDVSPVHVAPSGWEHHEMFMRSELTPPEWMVEGIWSDRSHGIIAGEPKSYKSLVATELAVAVASGCDFLGRFKTNVTGPVLMIQEENTPWLIQSRLRKIETARGLMDEIEVVDKKKGVIELGFKGTSSDKLPIEFLNQSGFDLSNEHNLLMLERKVQVTRPALVILDPMYMMLGDSDENSVRDMRPLLQWLLQLRVRYGSGIILVHHYAKQSQNNPRVGGQRMLGSMAFHGWAESALYIEKPEPSDPHLIRMSREHRNHEPQPALDIEIYTGDVNYDDDYRVDVLTDTVEIDPVVSYVSQHPRGATMKMIQDATGLGRKTIEGRAKKFKLKREERPRKNGAGRPEIIFGRTQ